jgi:predicted TPR repeat methyltransferase
MADPRVKRHLQQGIKLHQSGQLAEADTHYRKVLTIEPNNPDALHMSGVVALQQGRPERALALIVRARNGYPRMPELHNHLGMAQRALGRSEDALASFRTALLLNPRLADAHSNLVDLLADRGALQEALAQAQHSLRLEPRHPALYNSLGNVLQRLKRYDEAVAIYRSGLAMHESGLLQQNLGNALRELKDYPSAAAAYRRAMALEPHNHRICLTLGATLERIGQREAAEEAYREALRRHPGWDEAAFFLSALHNSQSEVPATAPAQYIAQLFDGYANTFEQHLIGKLNYRAPQLLCEAIRPHLPEKPMHMLDLGCGTGLLGELLRPHAATLHGVDLSEKMLAEAKQRNVYDQLAQADIVAALSKHHASYDAVLASDVLIYIGDLEPLYRATTQSLRPGGLFAFTVEANRDSDTFRLLPSRRYAHAATYLRALAEAHGFVELGLTSDVLRAQSGQDITGHIAVFRRTANSP